MNNQNILTEKSTVCIIGAGIIGLPLAILFSKKRKTIVYDIDKDKILLLSENNKNPKISFSTDPSQISKANFVIICVPTYVTRNKKPDISFILSAARTVGQHLKKGSLVIVESTVYPGTTEDVLIPIIEKESGLKHGLDFGIANSPERVNPGDELHTIDNVTKIVSADNEENLEIVAELYKDITPRIFKAANIRTAEAAKLVENVQRDVNIGLVNELSYLFSKIGLNTKDVLDAAATKWNFMRFTPGLVGGYCIPIAPYLLSYSARNNEKQPALILAGRTVNDLMPDFIIEIIVEELKRAGKTLKNSKVLIMGITYKENVNDIRETPCLDMVTKLKKRGLTVLGYDPVVTDPGHYLKIDFIDNLKQNHQFDCAVVAIGHDAFRRIELTSLRKIMNESPILVDVKNIFNPSDALKAGFVYRSL